MHTHNDNPKHNPEQGSDSPGDSIGNLIPFPRSSPQTQRSPITGIDWRVERIDTEPMTSEQYDVAVTALAALIAEWEQEQNNPKKAHENNDDVA